MLSKAALRRQEKHWKWMGVFYCFDGLVFGSILALYSLRADCPDGAAMGRSWDIPSTYIRQPATSCYIGKPVPGSGACALFHTLC